MFQYAAGRYFATRYNAELEVAVDHPRDASSHGYPRPFLLSEFSIKAPFHELTAYDRLVLGRRKSLASLSTSLKTIFGINEVAQEFDHRHTFLEQLPIQDGVRTVYLVGYWQAHRFAEEVSDELGKEFTLRNPATGRNLELLEDIQKREHPISLHIRRGDYTLAAEGNIALPITYYSKAIRHFQGLYDRATFFVFSDDIDFARRHLPRDIDVVFVNHNDSCAAHEDLRLMTSCRDNIIANSTFSWWGAWLNPHQAKVVIAPRYWHLHPDSYYPDLLPQNWILLDHRAYEQHLPV